MRPLRDIFCTVYLPELIYMTIFEDFANCFGSSYSSIFLVTALKRKL